MRPQAETAGCVLPACTDTVCPPAVDEPHLSLPHMDPPSGEEVPVAPPQLEGEAAAAMRPSLTSGYSKQFQKSLPPRFLRQQVS